MRSDSRRRPALLAATVTAVTTLAALGAAAPSVAAATPRAHPVGMVRGATLPPGERYVCPAPVIPGQMQCMSIVRADPAPVGSGLPDRPANGFYGPADLREAYKIATAAARDGRGRTIAIVDAYSDPRAASDLATYRSHFHLGACTQRDGCLRILNEFGHDGPLPKANWDWAGEESLDLDMVSAICPRCHILLIEARSAFSADLGIAEDTAVAQGAKYVSNSWAGGEFPGQDVYDHYFNHPGVVIDFAAGDFGYGTVYPTDLQYVTAIGGTSLRHAANGRGWTESVWGSNVFGAQGTGSGCSPLEAKPSWQRADATAPGGCLNRTQNDVAAVASPRTGVAIYDSYPSPQWSSGWNEFGGTSAATPIVTAIYALAGTPAPRTYPSEYPYLHQGQLFEVASGTNGTCESYRRYLCHGGDGYNGPAGLGTPDGTAAFSGGSARHVTVVDPGTVDRPVHARVSLWITGLDATRGSRLRWSATGLPAGLSIHRIAHSNDALITGNLPAAPGAFRVTVTAKDGAVTGGTQFSIVALASPRAVSPPSGPFVLASSHLCVDGGTDATWRPVRLQSCDHQPSQDWTYRASWLNDIGTLAVAGHCLAVSLSKGVLADCDGSPSERWQYLGLGAIENPATGRCLAAFTLARGAQVKLAPCDLAKRRRYQAWGLPAGALASGAGALCADDGGNGAALGTPARVTTCDGTARQQWTLDANGNIRGSSGLCLDGSGSTIESASSILDGTAVILNFCSGTANLNEVWLPGPAGELINRWSGKCLADYGQLGPGARLTMRDCYGNSGEIWGVN